MSEDFTYVRTNKQLIDMCNILAKEKVIGVDLECENNLHHYGVFITLIQISTEKENFIVDVLELKGLDCLIKLFENESINKIFYDISFDLRILKSEFNCKPNNVYDAALAANLAGLKKTGLKDILEEFFDVEKVSKFQKADWTRRPIKPDMLAYAVKDSLYLIKLKKKLNEIIKEKGRVELLKEEMKHLNTLELSYELPTFESFSKLKFLDEARRGVLRRLFVLREDLAKRVDRPIHFIMSNKKFMEIIEGSPHTIKFWKTLKGVHPIVKSRASLFFEAEVKGMTEPVVLERPERKKFSPEKKKIVDYLEEKRLVVSEKMDINAHLIASREQIKQYAITEDKNVFRKWQFELLEL